MEGLRGTLGDRACFIGRERSGVQRSRDFPDLAGVGNGRYVPHLPEVGKPLQIILPFLITIY